MHVESLTVGQFEVNCYLAWASKPLALVIDPGADAEMIREELNRRNLTVGAYLLTHGHMDHVSAMDDMVSALPAPVFMHPKDAAWAFTDSNTMLPFYGGSKRPPDIRLVAGNQDYTEAGLSFRVLETPGHTPGGICFLFREQGILFTGDTLFSGTVGRTDLSGGNSRAMTASIKILASLPDETVVYPGHGPSTTIGNEKRVNPYL
jgi:hydroxyacylglutathione hydrolase